MPSCRQQFGLTHCGCFVRQSSQDASLSLRRLRHRQSERCLPPARLNSSTEKNRANELSDENHRNLKSAHLRKNVGPVLCRGRVEPSNIRYVEFYMTCMLTACAPCREPDIYIYIYSFIYLFMFIYIFILIYFFTYLIIYIYLYLFICRHINIYIYTDIYRKRGFTLFHFGYA